MKSLLLMISLFIGMASSTFGQSTAFTYQGSLKTDGAAANGTYDFEFALYNAATGGTQSGSTNVRSAVAVAEGVFGVELDFGSQFNGDARFLEIRVKPAAGGSYTTLTPRQTILSTPYAIRSLSATNASNSSDSSRLGGIVASQYVLTTDSRMTDARTPLAGSGSYIQNSSTLQPGTNFNISGNGTVGATLTGNILRANSQFNLGANRVLFAGAIGNTFVGIDTGNVNTAGNNTFVGNSAGKLNTLGAGNAFFGSQSGLSTTTGGSNSFFGTLSGRDNVNGEGNSFFGTNSGDDNIGGTLNTFIGAFAGTDNVDGSDNTFVGADSGGSGTDGQQITLLGGLTTHGSNISNSTAIGYRARVDINNALVLGSVAGVNSATATVNVGIGKTAPTERLDVVGNARVDGNVYLTGNGRLGIGTIAPTDELTVNGKVSFTTLGSAGVTVLCRNNLNQLALCSSSIRYKTNVSTLTDNLSLAGRFRPVRFNWIADGKRDLGLIAEEVAAIDPDLAVYNEKGEVEGIKYDRFGVIAVGAVNEQQKQIEELRETIRRQQEELEALKALVCAANPNAGICSKPKE